MNEHDASPAEGKSRVYPRLVEPADFFIKGSVTLSIAVYIFGKSMETVADGGFWSALGVLMFLGSIPIVVLGVMGLTSSASALEALVFNRAERSTSNQRARTIFSWAFAILVTATLFGLYRSLGFVTLP